MLHYFAIALIIIGVGCFAFVPVLGASLFIVGVVIETVGYLVWGAADFWHGRRAKEAPAKKERS